MCSFFFMLVQMRMGACIGMTLLFNQIMTRTNIILLFKVRENVLTSTGCVHSNMKVSTYITVVYSSCSSSPVVQKYCHLTSGSVEVPLATTTRNSSFIWKVPVPQSTWTHGISKRGLATSR